MAYRAVPAQNKGAAKLISKTKAYIVHMYAFVY